MVVEAPPHLPVPRTSGLQLCQAAAAGERNAQQELLGSLIDRVRRTAAYIMGPDADAEDVAQSALLEILNACGSFRGDSGLEYWADRITVRLALKLKKKKRRRAALFFGFAGAQDRPEEAKLPSLTLRQRLAVHLQKISWDRRMALVLHHVHGYTVPEIAQLLEVKPATVRDRLVVGKKQMRRLLLRDPSLLCWLADREGEA